MILLPVTRYELIGTCGSAKPLPVFVVGRPLVGTDRIYDRSPMLQSNSMPGYSRLQLINIDRFGGEALVGNEAVLALKIYETRLKLPPVACRGGPSQNDEQIDVAEPTTLASPHRSEAHGKNFANEIVVDQMTQRGATLSLDESPPDICERLAGQDLYGSYHAGCGVRHTSMR